MQLVCVMSVNRGRMCGHSEQIDEADQEGKFYHDLKSTPDSFHAIRQKERDVSRQLAAC